MVLDQLIILNWYFTLFSSLLCLILYWYCKERFSLSHSWEVKGKGNWNNIWQLQLKAIISTSLAERSHVSKLGSLTVCWSKICLSDRMANDTKKRCNVHSEKKFVLAKEINDTNNFKCLELIILNCYSSRLSLMKIISAWVKITS